jgi:hypothetical protein
MHDSVHNKVVPNKKEERIGKAQVRMIGRSGIIREQQDTTMTVPLWMGKSLEGRFDSSFAADDN